MLRLLKVWMVLILCVSSVTSYAMTFSLGEHSQKNQAQWKAAFGNLTRIYASGEIDLKTVSDFKKFMAKHPQITHAILFFDSPGGIVRVGIALGMEIRKRRFNTDVGKNLDGTIKEASCESACVYAHAGGTGRFLTHGVLGFHQFYNPSGKGEEGSAQYLSAEIIAYLRNMGIDPTAFIFSGVTEPSDMFFPPKASLIDMNFVNNGMYRTDVKLELVNEHQKPALFIYQGAPEGSLFKPACFILSCRSNGIHLTTFIYDPPFTPDRAVIGIGNERYTVQLTAATKKNNILTIEQLLPVTIINEILTAKNLNVTILNDNDKTSGLNARYRVVDISSPELKQKITEFLSSCQ